MVASFFHIHGLFCGFGWLGGFRPARGGFLYLPKKEPKMPWGLIPVSAFAQRALIVICPQTPGYGGTPSWGFD